ncbi:MAG: bifunctional folylpolyglutamate synthase/dihydrofolate synthase [Rhodospirillaceae bacterium]|nr:bifunctional folylpolyglutamate synthase/dihydrofolate synthase [Rhodospirillaceae bacterium]
MNAGAQDNTRDSADLAVRLNRLHPKVIDLSLGRIERLLGRLGNPHQSLPPVVHVAGTNGKGSVIAFARAIAEAAGLRVHAYTSPHLIRFNERICVGGGDIEDGLLLSLIEECEDANGDAPITFFELTTAVALLAFARRPADLLLLETGLGGRLDATNVIARPVITALTPISIDHVGFLGETMQEIAAEKAGILKPGRPCVMAAQDAAAAEIIRARARELSAPLLEENDFWSFEAGGGGFTVTTGQRTLRLPVPGLAGAHQVANAALAVTILDHLDAPMIDADAVAEGLRSTRWPARLQHLTGGALAGMLPGGWELWLDGGHNGAAGRVLADQASAWTGKPLYLIAGILNSKDPAGFLTPLATHAARLAAVPIPGEEASLDAKEVAGLAAGLNLPATESPSVRAAIETLVDGAEAPGRILICGSLYLAGHVLAENG